MTFLPQGPPPPARFFFPEVCPRGKRPRPPGAQGTGGGQGQDGAGAAAAGELPLARARARARAADRGFTASEMKSMNDVVAASRILGGVVARLSLCPVCEKCLRLVQLGDFPHQVKRCVRVLARAGAYDFRRVRTATLRMAIFDAKNFREIHQP